MTNQTPSRNGLSRRQFLKLGGGAAVLVAGSSLMSAIGNNVLRPISVSKAQGPADAYWVATDGWIHLPEDFPVPGYFPDDLAPAPYNAYIFGFRDVTGLTPELKLAQKGRAGYPGPLILATEGVEHKVNLTNLGLTMRPDLIDSHTIHWHGFRNAIPFFDGEPTSAIAVPIGQEFTYLYRPHDPGTYFYHCHFEDTEHVHMGMAGVAIVLPAQNQGSGPIPAARYNGGGPTAPMGYVFNDGVMPGDSNSTAYDREFVVALTDFWAEAHWADSHIQLPDWSVFNPDFWFMNGRCYPDTLAPHSPGLWFADPGQDGWMQAPPGRPDLQSQWLSSLIQVNAGDRVLLRIICATYQDEALTIDGIPMKVVGRDGMMLRGRDGTVQFYDTNVIPTHSGESFDVLFTAPQVTEPTTFLLHNTRLGHLTNAGGNGYGGQMTEVRVYPSGTLPQQTLPHQLFDV